MHICTVGKDDLSTRYNKAKMDYAEEEELSEDEDWSAPLGDTEAALDTEPNAGRNI